jgi:hypothetical protein
MLSNQNLIIPRTTLKRWFKSLCYCGELAYVSNIERKGGVCVGCKFKKLRINLSIKSCTKKLY